MFVPDSDNRMAGQGESCRSASGITTQCSCVVIQTAVANTTFPGGLSPAPDGTFC